MTPAERHDFAEELADLVDRGCGCCSEQTLSELVTAFIEALTERDL